MEFTVRKKYLEIPVSPSAQSKNIKIYENGILTDDFNVRLDYINPMYTAYYDISAHTGKNLTAVSFPCTELKDMQTDKPDFTQYEGCPHRPAIHFGTKFGWTNDPNGLVEYTSPVTGEKTYHMFYQFNPYDTVWGNMHWGHAVSSDLINWEEMGIALYPDENGTMYSGGGYVDTMNHSGLKDGGEDPILLYYTCAGGTSALSEGKKFTQCLAYSTDGGKTFEKYAKNPIIDHVESENRDPKVVWCDELDCYIMTFYLEDNRFTIYTSKNLLDWAHLQDIELKDDGECPDLYPIAVNGNKDNVKWVLIGASQLYAVLEIQNGRFAIIQEPQKLEYGANSYAPQSFANVSDGRCIAISWIRNTTLPYSPFCSHMSIPFERTLTKKNGKYYLCSNPIEELANYVESQSIKKDVQISAQSPFEAKLDKSPYDITIKLGENFGEALYVSLLGTNIEIHPKANEICLWSGCVNPSWGPKNALPLSLTGDTAKIRIIADADCLEVISDEGSAVMTYGAMCDYNANTLEIRCENPVTLQWLEICKLKKIL